jgi:mannose-1-phosphate guanylyltransferase
VSLMKQNYYALIMAGGGGTRLWPLSRKDRPKQVLPLVEDNSMFCVSVRRLYPLFNPDHIFVVTGANMVGGLRADVPELPAENFIVEPFGQESGPAAGLGTTHILAQNPEAVVAVLTSDHHIADVEAFLNTLKAAYQVATWGYIVTLGISPSFPATGFGYIERGEFLDTVEGFKVYHSNGFKEKPDQETAIKFLTSGRYSWNSGMFIWRATQALSEFEKQHPTMYQHFETIRRACGTPDYNPTIGRCWPAMTRLSVDYAIMEHAAKVAVIPVDIGWSDIGSWSALYDVLATTPGQNVTRGTNGHPPLALDTSGSLIVSKRTVVTIGVSDLVIIDTDDVLMICHRNRTQDVRQIVNRLREIGREDLL